MIQGFRQAVLQYFDYEQLKSGINIETGETAMCLCRNSQGEGSRIILLTGKFKGRNRTIPLVAEVRKSCGWRPCVNDR